MPYQIGSDIIGADELLGYDEIGAMTPAALRAAAPRPQVRTQAPSKSREVVMGFDSVATIASAASAKVSQRPQVLFRPDKLVVASSIAAAFLIDDFKVGNKSQFAASGSVSAETFKETAVGVRLMLDTAQVSMDITISVTNISLAAARFLASLIGPAVE
jgi:hypothetical protein